VKSYIRLLPKMFEFSYTAKDCMLFEPKRIWTHAPKYFFFVYFSVPSRSENGDMILFQFFITANFPTKENSLQRQ
jgi:hypothetical protein